MGRLLINISIARVFSRVLEFIGDLSEDEPVPRDIEVLDIEFKIIGVHLDAIVARAEELKDEELLKRCEALGLWVPDLVPEDLLIEPHTTKDGPWYRITHKPTGALVSGPFECRHALLIELTKTVHEKGNT